MKLSDYVIKFIIGEKIKCIFEVCGGSIAHLLNSLYGKNKIADISMHHEQAAAFAAEGYSRASGNIGVALATSGPGATNLITGIGSAYFDNIPCIFITGQVNTYEFKFNKPVRQVGFQETDIVKIIRPLVKEAILVKDPDKIRYYLEKAVFLAKSGRPGPVLLDIPMNIQRADINPSRLKRYQLPKKRLAINKSLIKKAVNLLSNSSRPIILSGGGVRLANAGKELLRFIQKSGIPVVTSLMGLDSVAHDNDYFTGMIGTYGNRQANLAIANADLVLALGTRFDTRQTGTRPETFARGSKIIHVDIDPHELNNKVKADLIINSDLKDFLKEINRYNIGNKPRLSLWKKQVNLYKKRFSRPISAVQGISIEPHLLMHMLSTAVPADAIICIDIGQNQMWAAQSLKIRGTQRLLTQGGMAAMGSALSMGIGAAFAQPGKTIVVVTGDGGFQLNIQELETLYHYQLPVKIVLLNNHCYGMVRQFQEQYFSKRYQATVIGYSSPDFQDVVKAYKIKSNKIKLNNEIKGALKRLLRDAKPGFLEVDISKASLVTPKLAVNRPLEDQEPYLSEKELAKNMIVPPLLKREVG
ncbi:MAG TPA: thiamine pyrophosphate-binding protein [Candidatus Omnitrophota bacterium]|nr:thiamine pyrophosphate-binding protein [Candidatus Omnitrophota bacterium]